MNSFETDVLSRIADHKINRAFLTKVDAGFVKKKCYNKGIERGFDSIKT